MKKKKRTGCTRVRWNSVQHVTALRASAFQTGSTAPTFATGDINGWQSLMNMGLFDIIVTNHLSSYEQVLIADPSEILYGSWGPMRVEVDNSKHFEYGSTLVRGYLPMTLAMRHGEAAAAGSTV